MCMIPTCTKSAQTECREARERIFTIICSIWKTYISHVYYTTLEESTVDAGDRVLDFRFSIWHEAL